MHPNNAWRWWATALLSVALAACGGGSDPAPSPGGGVVAPTGVTITGTAATGAPFSGATITVFDNAGTQVGQTTVGADGTYSVSVDADAQPPFVLVAERTTIDGDAERLVGVLTSTSQTRANITPVTTVIAALLSPTGRPEDLASGNVDPDAVAAAVTEVQALLTNVVSAVGAEADIDPLTGVFDANGEGYDLLLDSIRVVIEPVSGDATNIQLAVVQGDTPEVVSFTSNDENSLPPAPTVDPALLPVVGASTQLAALLDRASTCYNLPLAQRVNGMPVGGVVSGGQAIILDPGCRNLFVQDSGGAITFRSNGAQVSSTQAFSGIFRERAANVSVRFTAGAIEYLNGSDVVVSYRVRTFVDNVLTNETVQSETVSVVDNEMRFKGNGYQFPGEVLAFHQYRRFLTQDQSANDYYSTGYNLNVRNLAPNNTPLFDRVEVTTPRGNVVTLVPGGGTEFLVVDKGQGPTGTSFVRLRSEFVDTNNPGNPASVDTPNLVTVNPQWTNTELEDSGRLGVWTFRYYLASNPTQIAATQVYRNLSRALSVRELRARGWAQFTPALASDIASTMPGVELDPFGRLFLADDEPVFIDSGVDGAGDGWEVPAGALPPTIVTVFGRTPPSQSFPDGQRFTDQVTVSTSARRAAIECSPLGGVNQCQGSGPLYLNGTVADGIHLLARDAGNRQFATFYAFYDLSQIVQP